MNAVSTNSGGGDAQDLRATQHDIIRPHPLLASFQMPFELPASKNFCSKPPQYPHLGGARGRRWVLCKSIVREEGAFQLVQPRLNSHNVVMPGNVVSADHI